MKSLVVDGTNLVMRCIKASERMSEPLKYMVDGYEVNTSAVYLFIQMFSKYVRQEEPDRMIVCWDGGRSQYRTIIYPKYKGDREERQENDLTPTFSLVKEFLSLNGIHHLEVPQTEADDLVAAYTRSALSRGSKVVILSGDKDFLQLIGPDVVQIRPGVQPERWGEQEVRDKFGCEPHQMAMVMALTGDKGDGVPGIPRFGEKTAVKYLAKYGWDWHSIVVAAGTDEEKLLAGRDGEMMRNMALVNLQVEIDPMLEDGYIPEWSDHPELVGDVSAWLGRFGFQTLLNRHQAGTLWREPIQGRLV